MDNEATEQFRRLRDLAEKLASNAPQTSDLYSPPEIERLLHDLQVHQIELELQNEDLRTAQRQLEDSRNRYAALYNHAPVGYVTLDPRSMILQANDTFLAMVGISHAELNGKTLSEFLLPEDRTIFHARFKAFFKSPAGKSMEFMLQPVDAPPFMVTMTGRVNDPVISDEKNSGASQQLFLVIQDIRKLRETEEALRESEQKLRDTIQEKDLLFSLIADDLREPVSALLGILDQMPEEQHELSDGIYRPSLFNLRLITRNMDNILGDLAAWARLQQGETSYRPQLLFLYDVIEETVNSLSAMADHKAVVLINMIRHEQRVYADRSMLERVARNLIHNAIKFTPREGRVFLASSDPDEGLCSFYVKDTGIGMEPSMVEKLFRPNDQIIRKGTENETSTGLGLILSKELVEKNNGRIEAESQPGKGSTFTVRLPVKPV